MDRFEKAAHDLERGVLPILCLLRAKLSRAAYRGDARMLAALSAMPTLEQEIDTLIEGCYEESGQMRREQDLLES